MLLVPRTLTLAPVIIHDDKESFDEIMQTIEEALEQRRVQATQAGEEPMHVANSTRDEDLNGLECLFEKCSGNQNILHLCAGNINCSQNSRLQSNQNCFRNIRFRFQKEEKCGLRAGRPICLC